MARRSSADNTAEERAGVRFSSLDQPLFDGAGATKRDLVDYLDAVADRIVPELADRPLSVIRVRPGQEPFMQKNVPRYTPDWVRTVTVWAEASHREVRYALCDDRRTLLWFANQRAVEYHPALLRGEEHTVTHLVLDLDPPAGDAFGHVVAVARLVRQALADAGLAGAVKTSGAKGVHVVVPVREGTAIEDAAAATRALAARAERLDPALATTAFIREDRHGKVFVDSTRAGGATVVAAYSPRARPGVPVSFPLAWDALDGVTPADLTVRTAVALLGDRDPWRELLPAPQELPADLVAEGHTIPIARVQAMHEGKRRARARRG
ncbi:MAG: non-homologous end-joining DNA ligase [Pseudonocardia sp.]